MATADSSKQGYLEKRVEYSPVKEADKTALVIIDMQNDFCEGGSLAVKGAEDIVPIINNLRTNTLFDYVFTSKDWHEENHVSFCKNHPGKELFTEIIVPETKRK